ncbi:MAG: PIN domain-containing protein [Nitrosopumilus sp.]
MDAIFLDTNSIRNPNVHSFFGNSEKYQRISQLVQVVIPSIVIEEIKRQKKKHLLSQFDKFKNNYFTEFLGCNTGESLKKHIDKKIEDLYKNAQDEISYIEEDLKPEGKLEIIKELAIKNIPPFETVSDKGFKDSYIYLTVLQYVERASDDVFIITNDSRLQQAFDENKNVKVLSSPEEYFNYRKEYFKEDYFIGRMQERFEDDSISRKSILNVELTEDDDWQISIEVNGEQHEILVDFISKEIIQD